MTDNEFIGFLVHLLENDLTDGDTPSQEELTQLKDELEKRQIESDIFQM